MGRKGRVYRPNIVWSKRLRKWVCVVTDYDELRKVLDYFDKNPEEKTTIYFDYEVLDLQKADKEMLETVDVIKTLWECSRIIKIKTKKRCK